MVSWGWLIVAFMLGGWCGITIIALCSANQYKRKEDSR
jgi:hypothetical protein